MSTWRLLDTGPRSAAENIALDEVILGAVSRGESPDTLRFLQFTPAAVLVGYHQAVEQEVREDYCRDHGIDINRRITGGGAIFFDTTQLGWEVIARVDRLGGVRPEEMFTRLSAGAIRGLKHLGVKAGFRPVNDIEVRGRKISGTGGTRLGNSFLFQGTLLIDFDVQTMVRALRLPAEKLKDKEIISFQQRVTCLREELRLLPTLDKIKAAIARGMAEELGLQLDRDLVEGGLTRAEKAELPRRLPQMQTEDWIRKVRRPAEDRQHLTAAHKAPGGLIRLVVAADADRQRMKSVFIAGDFFAFPQRVIYDLEAWMKDAPVEEQALRQKVEAFFEGRDYEIPGVTVEDFFQAFLQAVRKLDYVRHGLAPDEVNQVFTVQKGYGEVAEASVLLLPYCAKPTWCHLRYVDACDECGKCTVGDAYRMARERGMKPITIYEYEHLEATLQGMRDQGVKGFVGCCCEPFYAKHQRDFERLGVPGALVDINDVTCYDLGEEQEAHLGVWDKETNLKLDLLERVLNHTCQPAAPAISVPSGMELALVPHGAAALPVPSGQTGCAGCAGCRPGKGEPHGDQRNG